MISGRFKNGNWMMKNIVGNWNISGTYTLRNAGIRHRPEQSGFESERR